MERATYPSLQGQTVFVTGGASGIGAELVAQFHAQGGQVAFVDLQADVGQSLADRLESVWFRPCDVTDEADLTDAIEAAAARLGPVTVLINNVANDTRRKAALTTLEDWRASFSVNLEAAFVAARTVYPMMRAAGGGAIINISSINALLGPGDLAAYSAAKGGLNALTKSLAHEWGAENIRVNALSPGWVATDRQLELWLTPQAEAEWMKQVALRRRLTAADVAQAALFLASADSSAITGQNLVVDGGRT